jgi:hypothetical protein
MPFYTVPCSQNTMTTTFKTAGIVTAAAAAASGIQVRRVRIWEFDFGIQGPPNATDTSIQIDISKQTAAGTTTAVTPVKADDADPVFMGLAGSNATAEGTVTASSSLFNTWINQRGAFRWTTQPLSGQDLICPATASNGFALRALTVTAGYVAAAGGTIYILE